MIPSLTFHNGNKIPQVGLGTSKIVGESAKAVLEAIKVGYRHFDDAPAYDNEKVIGDALKQSGVPRQELFITSKVRPQNMNKQKARQSVEKSLSDFGTDYLDLLLIHWPYAEGVDKDDGQKLSQLRKEVWETFISLKKQGKVKNIGVSNFKIKHLQPLLQTEQKPVVNQLRNNPYFVLNEQVQFCSKHGILIECYSPLGKAGFDLLEDPVLVQISQKYKKSVAQICLRWSVQHGHIVIPKSVTPSRIQQNISIFDFEINEQDMNKINQLHKLGKVPPIEKMNCE